MGKILDSKMFFVSAVLITITSLIGCGKESEEDKTEQVTFTDVTSAEASPREYQIQMQAAQFAEPLRSTDLSPAPVLPITELGKQLVGIKINFDNETPQKKILTVKLKSQVLTFEFHSGFSESDSFNVIDSTGAYEAKGRCFGGLCETARLEFSRKNEQEKTKIKYIRTNEFLQAEDLNQFKVSHTNDALLKEAIDYGFPVERHSSRVDEYRDHDILVVERPRVEEDEDTVEEETTIVELESTGVRVRAVAPENKKEQVEPRIEEESKNNPPPKPEARSEEKQRNTPIKPPQVTKKEEPLPVSNATQLSLTRNPFAAYNVQLPPQLFSRGTEIQHIGHLRGVNFNIIPISQQQDLEPAFRIATISEAMIDQKVRIYRNACNIFVRAAMALAGYRSGPWPKANDFENLFSSKYDGLNTWEKFALTNAASRNNVEMRMRYLLEDHAIVFQVERQGRAGHVGFITKENGKYYFSDASLASKKNPGRPPGKKETNLKDLLQDSKGVIRIHSLPNLLQVKNTSRSA